MHCSSEYIALGSGPVAVSSSSPAPPHPRPVSSCISRLLACFDLITLVGGGHGLAKAAASSSSTAGIHFKVHLLATPTRLLVQLPLAEVVTLPLELFTQVRGFLVRLSTGWATAIQSQLDTLDTLSPQLPLCLPVSLSPSSCLPSTPWLPIPAHLALQVDLFLHFAIRQVAPSSAASYSSCIFLYLIDTALAPPRILYLVDTTLAFRHLHKICKS